MVSVVIPTYKEADSVRETIRRSAASLSQSGEEYELIIVDDESGDGTAELAEKLSSEFPLRVLRRVGRRGLATAVTYGWSAARGDVLGVIDADLQHPPEILQSLLTALRTSSADVAIASRYVQGGGTSIDWNWVRRLVSWGATHLAATVLPLKLSAVTDPMSGMFIVKATAIAGKQLSPLGYKILLEVLAKGHIQKIVEVPYQFEERTRGSSKLGPRQYGEYLAHLLRLAWSTGQFTAWVEYSLVGLTGAAIDLGIVHWAVKCGWANVWAVLVAVQSALLWNFLWNQWVTFPRHKRSGGPNGRFLTRLAGYEKICAPGAILNVLLTLLLAFKGVQIISAAAVGVIADGLVNLLFNVPAIWKVLDLGNLHAK